MSKVISRMGAYGKIFITGWWSDGFSYPPCESGARTFRSWQGISGNGSVKPWRNPSKVYLPRQCGAWSPTTGREMYANWKIPWSVRLRWKPAVRLPCGCFRIALLDMQPHRTRAGCRAGYQAFQPRGSISRRKLPRRSGAICKQLWRDRRECVPKLPSYSRSVIGRSVIMPRSITSEGDHFSVANAVGTNRGVFVADGFRLTRATKKATFRLPRLGYTN